MDSYIAEDAEINESQIGNNCQLFKSSKINRTIIGDNSLIGDFSRIVESSLEDFVRIDRQNFILKSRIGACSYTGSSTIVMHTEIGKYNSISWGVTIGPGEHNYKNITSHDFLYNDFYKLKPKDSHPSYDRFSSKCILGNDIWIGANSTILRNVTIGNGAIIGANSIVTKDVPAYAIVAGCPAKIIKYRFSQKVIERIEKLEWWNFPRKIIKKHFDLFKNEEIEIVLDNLEEIKKTL